MRLSKIFRKTKKGIYMGDCKVNILGTEYEILYRKADEYEDLGIDVGGICDGGKKRIVLNSDTGATDEALLKENLRHEVIHAYLYESGLGANWAHPEMGHDETFVDWVAIQFPKIAKTYAELGCL